MFANDHVALLVLVIALYASLRIELKRMACTCSKHVQASSRPR
jgi:hypothetical protein